MYYQEIREQEADYLAYQMEYVDNMDSTMKPRS